MSLKGDAAWVEQNFPTAIARGAADKAIDLLGVDAPMSAYLDTWVIAYREAGGKTPKVLKRCP